MTTHTLLLHAPAVASPASTAAGAATRRPVTGSVHSWDLSTGVDGPGTRFVAFLADCPLDCPYCHNPDTAVRPHPSVPAVLVI
jgi:pyruvate formate lyase activating enzyme